MARRAILASPAPRALRYGSVYVCVCVCLCVRVCVRACVREVLNVAHVECSRQMIVTLCGRVNLFLYVYLIYVSVSVLSYALISVWFQGPAGPDGKDYAP